MYAHYEQRYETEIDMSRSEKRCAFIDDTLAGSIAPLIIALIIGHLIKGILIIAPLSIAHLIIGHLSIAILIIIQRSMQFTPLTITQTAGLRIDFLALQPRSHDLDCRM